MVVERDLPRRTAVQQVVSIFWNYRDKHVIRTALDAAFDVEPVTREFFAEYKRIFENAMGSDGRKKDRLREEIAGLTAAIRNQTGSEAREGVVDWRVQFAEAFGGWWSASWRPSPPTLTRAPASWNGRSTGWSTRCTG